MQLVLLVILALTLSLKFPRATVVLYFIFGVLPSAFSERLGEHFFDTYLPGSPLTVVDVIIIGMVLATILSLLTGGARRIAKLPLGLLVIGVSIWFMLEIMRNIDVYGMSAPGEFRYRYAMLLSVPYVMVAFNDEVKRFSLLRILCVVPLVLIYAIVIYEGFSTGWRIGPENRFVHATVSLVLFESLIVFFIAARRGLFKVSMIHKVLVYGPAGILLLIDGHRSVWLCVVASLFVLLWLREVRMLQIPRIAFIFLLVIGVAGFATFGSFNNLSDFVAERTTAYFDFQKDETARWRAAIWLSVLSEIVNDPLAGKGFGGGWEEIYEPETGGLLQVFPHSYYIMTLYKMGAIGLLLLLALAIRIEMVLYQHLRDSTARFGQSDTVVVTLAIVMLVVIHVFGIAYGWEYHSWIFVGLGLAACTSNNSSQVKA